MNKTFCLTTTILFTLACMVGAEEPATVRVAVIAGEGERAPGPEVVELLTADLSKRDGLILLERDEVDKVLAEQGLSAAGLVEPGVAVTAGRLLAVNVFAVVDRSPAHEGPALLRVQAIEARTGILLDSAFVEETDAAKAAPPLATAILAAVVKSQVPALECRYVALLGVQSEEPSRTLDGLAQALQFLLSHDLSQAANIRLLDRERLDRLTAEQALGGIDLELKTSALLVECGIRRSAGGDGLAFRVRLRPVVGGQERTLEGETAGQEVTALRRAVAASILTALDVADRSEAPGDPAKEAEALLVRVRHLIDHAGGLEAVRLAEAAYALAPAQETRLWLANAYNHYAYSLRSEDPSSADKERILTAQIRERIVTLEMLREHARLVEQRRLARVGLPSVWGSFWTLAVGADEPHVVDLFREFNLLRREIAHFQVDYYTRHANTCRESWFLSDAIRRTINDAPQWAASADAWAAELKQLLRYFPDPACKNDRPCGHDGYFVTLANLPNLERFRQPGEAEVVNGLWQWMIEQEYPLIVLMGYANRVKWDNATAAETAREAWAYFQDRLPIDHPQRQRSFDQQIAPLMASILAGMTDLDERAACYLAIMGPVLDSGEGERVYEWLSNLAGWWMIKRVLSTEESRAWGERVLRIYLAHEALMRDTGKYYNRSSNFVPGIERFLASVGAEPAPTPGLWSRFAVQELILPPPTQGSWNLDWIWPTPDGWLVVWLGRANTITPCPLAVMAYAPGSEIGTMLGQLILPPLNGGSPYIKGVAQAHGKTYIGCYAGLIVCENGEAELWDESRGLPATRVHAMAALDDCLFLNVVHHAERAPRIIGTALCSLDLASGTITTLASSRSLEKRNPLDGEYLYYIESMLADESRGCVWLAVCTINGGFIDPVGLWRFVPASGKIEQVVKARSHVITDLTPCGQHIIANCEPLTRMDPDTGATEHLVGSYTTPYGDLLGIDSFALLGDALLVISASQLNLIDPGQLPVVVRVLPDGQVLPKVSKIVQIDDNRALVYPAPWEKPPGRFWIIERKLDAQQTEATQGERQGGDG